MPVSNKTFREGAPAALDHPVMATGLSAALIDHIECGLIVCDDLGTIRFANRAAERELADHRVLRRDGRLIGCVHNAGAFDKALRHAAERGMRCMLRMGSEGDSLMLSVQPLTLPDGSTGVLIVLGRRMPCSDLGLQMLGSVYGLTLAERRVLAGLVRNATPREIATQNCVSLNTVRTQILAIRGKVGARSIDELLLRVSEAPPVASALRYERNEIVFPLAA